MAIKLRHHWYEKIFFKLQMCECKCAWILVGFFSLMLLMQILLTHSNFRSRFILTEKYEGQPVKFYKSFKAR